MASPNAIAKRQMDVPNTVANSSSRNSMTTRISILLFLWLICFAPILPKLFWKWLDSPENSHGILVPFISLYLVWQQRGKLGVAGVLSSGWGAVVLIGSMVLYLFGYAGGIDIVPRTMIVFSLCGLILFVLGKDIFRILAFPILFLLFMIPSPDTLMNMVSFPLQLFATKISHLLIQAFGIPSLREGNMLYFAQTQLEVAEACSGIRSMMAFTMLSFLFAYIMPPIWGKRACIIVSAIPLALFANIVRVTGTGVLAHFYGAKVARGFLHEFSGLAVFAFGFMLLFLEYSFLARTRSEQQD
jgi:exosortase